MTEVALNEQYQSIVKLINQQRLKDALTELERFLQGGPDWTLYNEMEEVRVSYHYMLQYMRKNTVDPGRKTLFIKLLSETLTIADQARVLKAGAVSNRYYYSMRRFFQTQPPTSIKLLTMELESYTEDVAVAGLLAENQELQKVRTRHEEIQRVLFHLIWLNSAWKMQDEEEAKELFKSVLVPVYDLCLFVSAITLSLMECFDARKLLWLLHACEHTSTLVNQRAMVGLVFIFQLYHERLHLYPEIIARLSIMNEDPRFGQMLSSIQIQMIRSQGTAKIDKKMREEIIPEMIKSVNTSKMKFDFEDSDEEGNDHNPDWSFDLENSALGNKLREMNELQMEGSDVYMSTFSQLKNYPFFKTISNWFYPFDKDHPSIVEELGKKDENSIIDLILNSGLFCDSDKYSMCFTIMHIPKAQRDSMLMQMSEQQLNMISENKNAANQLNDKPEIISNQYIHNLYRFFKLYPRRHEFRDLFNEPLRLHSYNVLKPILDKPELLRNLADFYFKKEYTGEAAETYSRLLTFTGNNAEIYQKIGYCMQKEKKYNEAIEAYLRADMIKPDNVWTNRHLATSYRLSRQFDKALDYYHRIEEVEPENKTVLFSIGSCLTELDRNDEALNYFFKLDFIDPTSTKTWRAIAWCSFLSEKWEQSARYYEKILKKAPQAPDFMNAGHLALCTGDLEKAIEMYTQSIKALQGRQAFITLFNKDRDILIRQGINEDDIPLIIDLL